jgi:hypothetical protein
MENRSAAEIASPQGCPEGVSGAKQSSTKRRDMAKCLRLHRGCYKTVACEEKRIDDRPAENGALNSGRLVSIPFEEIFL